MFVFLILPVGNEASKKISADKYLRRYGYYGHAKTTKVKPEVKMKAIENFQRMANVPVTKKMDSKTYEMMQMPRCGLPDILTNLGQTKVSTYQTIDKWNKTFLTWNISQFTQHLPTSSQLLTFQRAFSYWSDVVPLTFSHAESSAPDIDIKFVPSEHGDGLSFDGPGNILAHSFFPGSGPHEGSAHFDDTERWSLDEDGVDLLHVATHQLGHVLGLGHSTTPNAVMQPFYKGFDANFELNTDDVEAIQNLYGARYTTAKPSRDSPEKTTSTPNPKTLLSSRSEGSEKKSVETRQPQITSKKSKGPQGKPNSKSAKTSVKKNKKSSKNSGKKTICKLKFDAIIVGLDNKTIAFRKKYMYDLSGPNITQMAIKSVLMKSPINIGAALYQPVTKELFLFKGKKVWKYVDKKLSKGYPKIIKDDKYEPPNAALLWHNGHIFLFKKDQFWAWDEHTSGIMEGYPRSVNIYWPGLPEDVDAALRAGDSSIYFFKDRKYYKLDNVNRAVQKGYPKGTAGTWLRC